MKNSITGISSCKAVLLAGIVLTMPLSMTATPAAAQSAQAHALIQKFDLRESRQPARDMANWKAPRKVVIWQNEDRLPALSAACCSRVM